MAIVDVVIVGGGIAGLSVAYELSRRGVSLVVLESAARAGGVILSEEFDGYTIDAGPDSLLVQKPAGVALCEEIGLGPRLVVTKPPRLAYIQRGGQLHALPAASVLGVPTKVGPFLRTRLFSWPGKLRMGAELFVAPRRDEEDESIGAFMTRRFGREAATYLAEPLLAGIHAGDVDRLSVRALFPRFVEAERTHGSLLRAFSSAAAGRGTPSSENLGAFKSLPGGLSEMIRALVQKIGAANVRTNTRAVRVTSPPPQIISADGGSMFGADGRPASSSTRRFFAVTRDAPFIVPTAAGETVTARAVVLATPAYVTSALLREHDHELARLCADVRYTSTATVVLAFRRDTVAHPLNGSGFVVPRVERSPILAASWLSSKWPHRAPDDRVLLRTFVGGARDPYVLDQSDNELVSRSLSALRPLLRITGEPLFSRVYKWERASAQHDVGHLHRMAVIDRALERYPGLFLTGSGFRGVGIPDCVADGRATGAAVATFLQSFNPALHRS
jgi:protoporphyrinogen/coproporphyrinogen III oxidase